DRRYNGDAALLRCGQVNIVNARAVAADDPELGCGVQDTGGDWLDPSQVPDTAWEEPGQLVRRRQAPGRREYDRVAGLRKGLKLCAGPTGERSRRYEDFHARTPAASAASSS